MQPFTQAGKDYAEELRKAKPSWETDGKGMRGDAFSSGMSARELRPHQPSTIQSTSTIGSPLELTNKPKNQTMVDAEGMGYSAFQLIPESVGDPAAEKVWVKAGRVNGEIPNGMTIPETEDPDNRYLLTPSSGHTIFLVLTFGSNLVQNSVTIGHAATVPEDEPNPKKIHVPIGKVTKASNEPFEVTEQHFVGDLNTRLYYVAINGALHVDYFRVASKEPLEIPED
jgi:hypothetical protein